MNGTARNVAGEMLVIGGGAAGLTSALVLASNDGRVR
jgi:heterodisulfide reductase subunit A-like polyferredoxin